MERSVFATSFFFCDRSILSVSMMFPGRIVHRSEGEHRIEKNAVARTLCKVVLPYMLSVTMLLATEIFAKERICKACLCNISAFSYVQRFLQRREPSMRAFYWTELSLSPFRAYRAAVLQSIFVREVLRQIPCTVVAGGYPAALYQHLARKSEAFQPSDLDIFVDVRNNVRDIVRLYDLSVLAPLGLYMHLTRREHSGLGSDSESSHADTDISESETDHIEYLQTDEEVVHRAQWWTHDALHLNILEWVEKHTSNLHRFIQRQHLSTDVANAYKIGVGELRQVRERLPSTLLLPDYRVLHTIRMTPQPAPAIGGTVCEEGMVPRVLLPINVIFVKWQRFVPKDSSFGQTICKNFDLLACGISLTVNSDLSFAFQEVPGAFQDLLDLRLTLQPFAFACQRGRVDWQMQRLWKYFLRGFRFHDNFLQSQAETMPLPPSPRDCWHIQNDNADDSSSSCSEAARANDHFRCQRVQASVSPTTTFDYWEVCQAGGHATLDPVRQHLQAIK